MSREPEQHRGAPVPVPRQPTRDDVRPPVSAAFADEAVMEMLAEHLPLTLLMDLAMPRGPRSAEVFMTEGLPAQAWWETPGGSA